MCVRWKITICHYIEILITQIMNILAEVDLYMSLARIEITIRTTVQAHFMK